MADTTKRQVLHALFRYVDDEGRERFGLHGEIIEVSVKEAERGDRLEALGKPGAKSEPAAEVEDAMEAFPLEGDDLEAAQDSWVGKATVKQIDAAVTADPSIAEAVLAAEQRKDKPRVTLVNSLLEVATAEQQRKAAEAAGS